MTCRCFETSPDCHGTESHRTRAPFCASVIYWKRTSCAEQILKTVTDLLASKKLLLRTGTIGDVTLNSRDSSVGVRPARTSSTICRRNSAGYGGLDLDIFY